MEGIESCEDRVHCIQAKARPSALHAAANDTEPYASGPAANKAAGVKIRAIARNAAVEVYFRPVEIIWDLSQ